MKQGILAFAAMAACLIGCNTPGAKKARKVVRPVDATINKTNAYSQVFLDSNVLAQFIVSEKLNEEDSIAITDFYHHRNYQYAWFDSTGLAEQAPNFINLYRSYRETLNDSSLKEPRLDSLLDKQLYDTIAFTPNEQQIQAMELLLTRQFFKYAERAYGGQEALNLRELDWFIPRKKLDIRSFLDTVVANPGTDITDLLPVHPMFTRLQQQLAKYAALQKNEPWPVIEVPAKKWAVGDSVPAISKIKQRLHLLGDYTLTDTTAIYTDSVAVALKRYQQRMGLASTGAPGTETMAALNTPLKHLIQQILINMERARWVPKPGLGRYIVVNIPSFTLYVFDSGHQVWRTNVVVGKPASNTVIFNGDLKFVVLAPYWNVPYSIVKNEMGRTASYFAKRNMEVVGRYADGIPMVRQKPGPSNSLGKVKFLFPNSYNIYLHDTPAKDLFGQTKRAFSHGCIRVQNPAWLAEYLLKEMPEWTPQKIKETMDGKKEVSITLPKTIPVFIGYFTAWVDEAGALQLRPDIYKHDAKMATRLFEKPQ